MKGKIQVIFVLLLLAGGMLAIGVATYANRVQGIDTELVKEVTLEKAPVEIQVAARQSVTERLVSTGVLVAEQDVSLTAEVGGKVRKMTKSLGDPCKKGEIIVKLEADTYRLSVQQAKDALNQAEISQTYAARDWERMEKLKGSEVASTRQIDTAEGSYSSSKAAVAAAKTAVAVAARNLKETIIRCPFNGYIAERSVDPGATVSPGMPLARLVDTSRLTLTLSVTSDKLARLRVGQTATLSDPALPGQTYTGVVSRLGVAADPATRTFPVEVAVDDKGSRLHTGQVVQASLALQTFEDVVAIPAIAVQKAVGAPRVLTVKNEKVSVNTVELGAEIADLVVIKSGIKPGDEVIVIGGDELQEGAAVSVTRRIPGPVSKLPAEKTP